MRILVICAVLLGAADGLASTTKYWVEFTDKGISECEFIQGNPLYEEALQRFSREALLKRERLVREGVTRSLLTIEDAPLCRDYVESLASLRLTVLSETRWSNAVSVEIPDSLLGKIKSLSFVKRISPVRMSEKHTSDESLSPLFLPSIRNDQTPQVISQEYGYDSIIYHYGGAHSQLDRTGVVPLHAMGLDAAKVKIGFMDTGFRWEGMRSTKDRKVVSQYDYIYRDSIVSNEIGEEHDQDGHGSVVLSSAVGHVLDSVIGAAYNAEIYLAKTEDLRSETPEEEDYYAEAIENFEMQGVRIASSSLGYMFYDSGFSSYTYEDLDGKTTISARAASRAARLGMLCVTAMGNGGTTGYPYLNTPADADSILAVGALDVNDTIAAFSSRGPSADGRIKPEVVAPGVKVWTMSNADALTESGGTSLATPLVTGACALIMQGHPWATAQQVRKAVIESSAQHLIPDNTYGYGRINAYAAALELGTLIAPHRLWNIDTVYTLQVGIAANNSVKNPRVVYAYNVGGQFTNVLHLTLLTDSLIYSATFPPLPKGTHIRYYIESGDGADTLTRSPRNAPDSVYSFYVGDSIPNPPYSVKRTEVVTIGVYPNPTSEYVNITLPKATETLELRDIIGRVVLQMNVKHTTQRIRLSLASIDAGSYQLYVRQQNGKITISKLFVVR